MKLGRSGVALAIAGVLVGGILFGVAVTGHAATTQQVTATLNCTPAEVKTGRTPGCLLTVTNNGKNTANQVRMTVTAVADDASVVTFLPSDSDECEPVGSTLTCTIGQLSGVGTPGSIFTETYELDMPSSGASVTQTTKGAFSQKPNNRGSETIEPVIPVTTTQSDNTDFDARFANGEEDLVQTDDTFSEDNLYTTGAELLGEEAFTVGLSVLEHGAGANNPNCPTTGCFGGQVIDFDITSLSGTNDDLPDSYTLVITIADKAIPNSVQEDDLEVRHTTDLGTELLQLCPDTDSVGACIVDRDIATGNPKDATIEITGPGDGNGSWGVG